MSIRELVLDGVVGLRLPAAGFGVFDVAGADLIKLRLAHIVQQAADGKALHAVPFLKKALRHRLKDADAVHHQAMLAGTVILGAGRRREKVGLFQPLQKLLRPLPFDVGTKQLLKFLLVIDFFHLVASGILKQKCAGPLLFRCRFRIIIAHFFQYAKSFLKKYGAKQSNL